MCPSIFLIFTLAAGLCVSNSMLILLRNQLLLACSTQLCTGSPSPQKEKVKVKQVNQIIAHSSLFTSAHYVCIPLSFLLKVGLALRVVNGRWTDENHPNPPPVGCVAATVDRCKHKNLREVVMIHTLANDDSFFFYSFFFV